MKELDRYCEQINLNLTKQQVDRLKWNKPVFSKRITIFSTISLFILWVTYWF